MDDDLVRVAPFHHLRRTTHQAGGDCDRIAVRVDAENGLRQIPAEPFVISVSFDEPVLDLFELFR